MENRKYRSLLTQKQYLRLLFADMVSRFGDSLDEIAYSWIMYEITGSESLMAFILGLNYIPTVLLQPILGALVDRLNKKRVMVITDMIRVVIVTLLVLLYTNGALTPLMIGILTLCTSTVEAFRMPAGSSVVPLLLEQEYYTLEKAASFSVSRSSQLLGLIVSGGLIAWIGSAGVLWIDAATFLISAIVISTIQVKEKHILGTIAKKHILMDFQDGLSFLKSCKAVQVISAIGLVINFGLMPLSVFQTPCVSDYLNMGPGMLSYIKILMIVGMMVGAAITPKLVSFRKSCICLLAGMGMGISIICMYITAGIENIPGLYILLTFSMFCVGAGGGILNVVIGGCMMEAVPQEMMGRMSGLNSAIMEASMPLGSFLCSALVLKLSVIQIFLIFGICTILFYFLMFFLKKMSPLDIQYDKNCC